MVMTHLGHFYLCIPRAFQINPKSAQRKHTVLEDPTQQHIVCIDPGVRTFATCYDAKYGEIWEWGKGDFGRIQRLCHHSDKLQGRFSAPDVRHRKRYRMKRAWYRMIERIRNLVDEVHKKFIRWLIANHDVILLPKFETSQMTRRCSKRIRGKTARNMLTWSHYRFRMRLLTKVREHPHCRVILCNEAYTSKTCGECGTVHYKLGGNKVFKCPQCKQVSDRDFNAARNIHLRYLSGVDVSSSSSA